MKRALISVLLGFILTSCASSTDKPQNPQAIPSSSPEEQESKLLAVQGDIHRLLLAEFALRNGNLILSLEHYSFLAKKYSNPSLFKNVVHLAILVGKYVDALDAAESWFLLEGSSLEAGTIFVALAIKLDIIEEEAFDAIYLKSFIEKEPAIIIGSLLNSFKIVNLSVSGYQKTSAILAELEFLKNPSVESLELSSILSLRAENYKEAMQSIVELAKSKNLNLQLIHVLVAEAGKNVTVKGCLDWIKSLRAVYPSNKQLGLWEAILLSKSEQYESSRDVLKTLYSSFPRDNGVAFSLALLELQTDRLEKAKTIFGILLGRGYKVGEVNFYLGRISEIGEQYEEAANYYASVPSDGSENFFSSQIRSAFVLSHAEKAVESLQLLSGLSESFPSRNSEISLVKGEILSEKERYSEALEVYDDAINYGDYDSDLLYARAMVAEKLGRIDILEHDLRWILKVEPNNAEVLNALGYTLTNLTERHEEAYILIERAMTLRPHDFYILDSMGWVCYRLGRIQESIRYLEEAYHQGQDGEIAAHLIEVLWMDGRHLEARDLWERSVQRHPNDRRVHNLLQKLGL